MGERSGDGSKGSQNGRNGEGAGSERVRSWKRSSEGERVVEKGERSKNGRNREFTGGGKENGNTDGVQSKEIKWTKDRWRVTQGIRRMEEGEEKGRRN